MRVILVDDNYKFRLVLRSLVEGVLGHTVVGEATCGVTAVETIGDTEADLVLLDLSLPRLSGIGVLQQIRKFTSVKVLVLTIHSEQYLINQLLAEGADGICLKEHGRNVLADAMVKTVNGERPVFDDNYGGDGPSSSKSEVASLTGMCNR
jgi:DNA-binding NarL/FixJ family response regulator